jgi:type IV secretory pathway VirB9-like protein
VKRLAFLCALAAAASPAFADDARYVTVPFRSDRQTTVFCPAGLLCVFRLQAGERVHMGLNSQVPAFESQLTFEGDAVQTPILTFKPYAAGSRANVVVPTSRRTYLVLLESVAGSVPTYVRFTYPEDEHRVARVRPAAPPPPLTIAEQLMLACSWQTVNAPGDGYNADAQPSRWRPVRMCHNARQTWLELPPSQTVANDLPVLHELTPLGERLANYTIFAADRILRVDGVGDGYVLRDGGKQAMHVHRIVQAPAAPAKATANSRTVPASASTVTADPALQAVLGAGR